MENSGKVLFEGDQANQPQWYVAQGEKWIGPLTADDVYQKVVNLEISWAHYVWKAGQSEWKRICDIESFQAAVPRVPTGKPDLKPVTKSSVSKKSPPPAPRPDKGAPESAAEPKEWFLHYNDSQYGPFSTSEIDRYLRVGKIHGKVHIWRDGIANWVRIDSVELFGDAVEECSRIRKEKKATNPAAASSKGASPTSSRADEKRWAPRAPMVAKIMMAHQERIAVGVCRDVSVGGMQILTDYMPSQVGAKLKLNISPTDRNKTFDPFVAEGVVVRLMEDGRGFSFRFEKLSETAKRAIQNYIKIPN